VHNTIANLFRIVEAVVATVKIRSVNY